MQSRMPYKRFNIEFTPDECAASLPAGRQFGINSMSLHNRVISISASASAKPAATQRDFSHNRFDLLTLDADETSTENCSPHRRINDSDELDSSRSAFSLDSE